MSGYRNPMRNPTRNSALRQSASQILGTKYDQYYKNKNPFGGKGTVIIEEIEVDEDGNMLGKNYRMMEDKRPKNMLANPDDPFGQNKVFDAEDAYYLALRERKLKKKHQEMKQTMKMIKKE